MPRKTKDNTPAEPVAASMYDPPKKRRRKRDKSEDSALGEYKTGSKTLRIYKKGSRLSAEEVNALKIKAESDKAVFAARRMFRDLDRLVRERIAKDFPTLPNARREMLNTIREEIVDAIKE